MRVRHIVALVGALVAIQGIIFTVIQDTPFSRTVTLSGFLIVASGLHVELRSAIGQAKSKIQTSFEKLTMSLREDAARRKVRRDLQRQIEVENAQYPGEQTMPASRRKSFFPKSDDVPHNPPMKDNAPDGRETAERFPPKDFHGWEVFLIVSAVLMLVGAFMAFVRAGEAYADSRQQWWSIFWLCLVGALSAFFTRFLVGLFLEIRALLIDIRALLKTRGK